MTAVIAIAMAATSGSASAQQGEDGAFDAGGSGGDSYGLGDIVVTAQKREESMQETPLSISVVSGNELAKRGVGSLTDLMDGGIPSLRVSPFSGRTSALGISIRGITAGDSTQIARDSAVGVYLDGVYLGRSHALGGELYDIERVEVLKGPQGTLFGRNAVGGAVNIISKRPSGVFGIEQTVSIRNLGGWNSTTRMNLPEFANISIKVNGALARRGGFTKNPLAGALDFSEYDRKGLQAQALWRPSDNFSALYSFDISRSASTPHYMQITALEPDAPALAPIFKLEPDPVRTARAGFPLEWSVGKVGGHALTLNWSASDTIQLKSISAYRWLSQSQYDNGSGVSDVFAPNGYFGRVSLADARQDQYSQEFQLLGDFDSLDFVLGAYYFREDADEEAVTFYSNQFNATGTDYTVVQTSTTALPSRASTNRATSKALFGQATWTPPLLDNRLSLTAGLRYTKDSKEGHMTYLRAVVPNPPLGYTFQSSRVDPAFSIRMEWTPDVSTYLRWGRAYRAGGANSRSETFRTFGPEELSSWEAGLKSEFWNRRVRLNLAAFTMRYSHQQVDFTNLSYFETVNTDGVGKIKGLEAELALAPARGLRASLNYTFLDNKTPTVINPFTNLTILQSPTYSPRHAASATLDYDVGQVGPGTLLLHFDSSYTSPQYSGASDTTKSRSSIIVNGRVTLDEISMGRGQLSFSLWGRNLFDETYTLWDAVFTPGSLQTATVFGDRRTYGIDATIRF